MNHQPRRAALGALTLLPLVPVLTALPARAADGDANRREVLAAHDRFKAAWNQRDAATIAALLGDNGAFTTPYSNGTITGGAAVAKLLEASTFAAFPDFSVQMTSVEFVDARTMLERWVISGTWSGAFKAGPLAGAPPSGRKFTVPGVGRYESDGARLRSYDAWFDQLSMLAQIGVLGGPPPKPGG